MRTQPQRQPLAARLATWSRRRQRRVVAGWLLVVAMAVLTAPTLFGGLSTEAGDAGGSESERAGELVDELAPTGETLVAVADGATRTDVADDVAALRARAGVEAVETLPSRDGAAVLVAVELAPWPAGEPAYEPTVDTLRGLDADDVLVGGEALLDEEMGEQAAADLALAETISTPVVFVLLLVLFGGVVAAGLPVLIALVGVAGTLAVLTLAGLVLDVSAYAVNIVTMLGLGLAVDYALLLVHRFREERAVDPDVAGALDRTMGTAGRTVACSGLTVAASLSCLLVFPDDFLRSMGFAGLAVVLLDLLAALTLLPLLLGRFGHRIRPAEPRPARAGVLVGAVRLAQRRPLVVGGLVVVVLLVAAAPFLGARWADADVSSMPASAESRQVQEALDARFELPSAATVEPVTAASAEVLRGAALGAYVSTLRDLDGVRTVSARPGTVGTVVDVLPAGTSQGQTAQRLVHEVRAVEAPVPVLVGGDAAELVDYQRAIADRLPWALGLVALATFVLLFAFTGSVVVPVKALLTNALSLGAGFGALVWVFQDGNLGGLVGTDALGSLSTTTPVLLFAIAFGLSMDYEVFLLGRVAEHWRRTHDNDLAVRLGITSTGQVVTAAALLMVVVFGAFVAGGFSPVKQVGLGLALAVAVDATLVRMLLVPAAMTLLGDRNWWAPARLRRLHRRIGVIERPTDVAPAGGTACPTRDVAVG